MVSTLFPMNNNLHFSTFMDLLWCVDLVVRWDDDWVETIIMIA